jgi:hypothetical protein
VIPAPQTSATLISGIKPSVAAATKAANIDALINMQLCPSETHYDPGHVAAIGSTSGVLNKKCPTTNVLKYDLGTSKASHQHSVYQTGLSTKEMTHTGGTPSTAALNNRLQLHDVWAGYIAENINDARERKNQSTSLSLDDKIYDNCNFAIAQWYIDSNVPSRGHWTNSVNCKYNVLGAGFDSYNKTTVLNYSNGTSQTFTTVRDRIT